MTLLHVYASQVHGNVGVQGAFDAKDNGDEGSEVTRGK